MLVNGRPLKHTDDLEVFFDDPSVEDLRLSANGLFVCTSRGWQGQALQPVSAEELRSLVRVLSEWGEIQTGVQIPAGDAKVAIGPHAVRAHWILPPLSRNGVEITLRRIVNHQPLNWACNSEWQVQIQNALLHNSNVLVFGATGSGKSAFLSHLLRSFCSRERVALIEDYPELSVPNSLSVHLCARPDPFGSRLGVRCDLGMLVVQSLRMRPDRIVVGECRGAEASAIATALKTGHAGLLTTLHAGSWKDAQARFEQLAGESVSWKVGVHVERCPLSGERSLTIHVNNT
jgi:pilus assembly protein CpaF